jgi:hypothetical protein
VHVPPRVRDAAVGARVIGLLGVVEVLIRWMPLQRLSRLLGVRVDLGPGRPGMAPVDPRSLSPRQRRRVRMTLRLSARWPFSEGPCLRRSLVLARLLRPDDVAVRLGFPRESGIAIAHAWVELRGRPLEDVSAYQPFETATGLA